MVNGFKSMGQPKWTAVALADNYGLDEDVGLDDVLTAISMEAYGAVSPEEGDAPMRRIWGSEFQHELRAMVQSAANIRYLEMDAFGGSIELACADLYGPANVPTLMASVVGLEGMPERAEPLGMTQDLANLLVQTLAEAWHLYGGARDAMLFLKFARDALAGRQYIEPDVLWQAVGVAATRMGLHDDKLAIAA